MTIHITTVLWVLVTYLTLHLSNMESLSVIIRDMLLLCSTGMEGRRRRGGGGEEEQERGRKEVKKGG